MHRLLAFILLLCAFPGGAASAFSRHDAGELAGISFTGPGLTGTASATYAYRTGTRQIESVTFAEDTNTRLTQQRTYDDLHRLTGVTSQTGTVLAASGYTLDASGRRARTVLADGTWWQYTYDGHGQVTAAQRRRMAGSSPDDSDAVIPGQEFGYAYDGLGNRTGTTQGGGGVTADASLTYTPAASNQYTGVINNRTGIATGSADPAASVTVNSSGAPREGPWWGQSNTTASGSSAAWLDFSIDATLGGNTEHSDVQLLVPPSAVTPAYDADGNLTGDGLRTFTWDAENRLLSVTTTDTLLPAGAPMYRVTYQYDDGGRRIAQTVETRTVSGGSYVLAARRCFLFDGWNCVAEYDYIPSEGSATRTLFRSQVWGPDMGGGGAGGLLIVCRHTGPQAGTHFATHDGNGNVAALVDSATGTESARYDYDPFGNLLRASGPFAAENPFRFSSQFTDDGTGLVYYGYRHYDGLAGRWLSRDPIGESGGVNLYQFVGNDGVNQVDVLGMFWAEYFEDTVFPFWENALGKDVGGTVASYGQTGLNLISLGTATKADRLDAAYRSGQLSGTDYASANLFLFSEGMLKAATLGAGGAAVGAGEATLFTIGAEGAKAAFLFSTTDRVFDRALSDRFELPCSRTGADDIRYILISTGTGYFIGVFAGGTFTILGKVDDAFSSAAPCFTAKSASELGPEAVACQDSVNAAMAKGNIPRVKDELLIAADDVTKVTSPNTSMRMNANVRGDYVDPLTGKRVPAASPLPADHVVPQSWIRQQPGFSALTPQQQSWLLNHPLNTQGLPTTFNSSKGATMPGDWQTYKGQQLDPSYIQNEAQRAQFLRDFIQQQIRNLSKAG